MAPTGVAGTVCRDPTDLLIRSYQVKKAWQHGRIPKIAARHFDGTDLHRLFINANVDLAPEAAPWATMFARIPRAFALRFDACAVDERVPWTL
jgi:hypothetical protein